MMNVAKPPFLAGKYLVLILGKKNIYVIAGKIENKRWGCINAGAIFSRAQCGWLHTYAKLQAQKISRWAQLF
jgi:hypothetical protein